MKTIAAIAITAAALVAGCGYVVPGIPHAAPSTTTTTASPTAAHTAADEQFLNTVTLNQMGCAEPTFIGCGADGEDGLIDFGKDICRDRRKAHWSESTTVAELMRTAAKVQQGKALQMPITEEKATMFVQAAETAYCPDLLGH
jgi:hypothetical protein